MNHPHSAAATGSSDLTRALSDLADAVADTLRHLLPLMHHITRHHQHLTTTTTGQQAAGTPSPGTTGPTVRSRAPRRMNATGVDPSRTRRTHRYRRRR